MLSNNRYLNQINFFLKVIYISTNINLSLINFYNIVILNYNFSNKVYNENFHYIKLIIEFI